MTSATQTTAPTKEQRLAVLRAQQQRLAERIYNLENDIVTPTKKEVPLPEVGAVVKFSYGRKTATTEPTIIEGTVVAVKPSTKVGEKTTPAQIKVEHGEGFDKSFAVIYPAQITSVLAA